MDPDATLAMILDSELDSHECMEAVDALSDWCERGGFTPTLDNNS